MGLEFAARPEQPVPLGRLLQLPRPLAREVEGDDPVVQKHGGSPVQRSRRS